MVRNYDDLGKGDSQPVFTLKIVAYRCGYVITIQALGSQVPFTTGCSILWLCDCNLWSFLFVCQFPAKPFTREARLPQPLVAALREKTLKEACAFLIEKNIFE